MAVMFKMLADGGFVAGDTETRRTAYAYPTSTMAVNARRHPTNVAAEMLAREAVLSDATRARVAVEYDARNWEQLNA